MPMIARIGWGCSTSVPVKLRLLGSIVAIAAIQILETFVHIDEVNIEDAAWQLAILIGIGVVGALLALTDRLSDGHGRK